MELITPKSGLRLDTINRKAIQECSSVDAAIAYVSDNRTLLKGCLESNKCLRLWVRFDHSLPVRPDILRRFVERKSPNYQCKLVYEKYHPKVIWWRDYGAYIGSANLSDTAWFQNVEAGVFFEEKELNDEGMYDQLVDFFEQIDENSHPLTASICDKIDEWAKHDIHKEKYKAQQEFDALKILPTKQKGIYDITKEKPYSRQKNEFLKEWNATLENMKSIATRVSSDEYRPTWIPEGTSSGTQADQFLHAYYYQVVKDGNRHPYMEHYHKNKDDPESALVDAMKWWKYKFKKPDRPNSELTVMEDWSPYHREHLSMEKVRGLNEEEFAGVCRRVHAINDHSLRVSAKSYGLKEKLPKMVGEQRVEYLAKWLYKQRAKNGDSPLDCLYYVLYGGATDKIPERIFEACHDPKRRIRHFGLSSIGELVGWAMPDDFPPRNGRSSKALKALGFNVLIHSGDSES